MQREEGEREWSEGWDVWNKVEMSEEMHPEPKWRNRAVPWNLCPGREQHGLACGRGRLAECEPLGTGDPSRTQAPVRPWAGRWADRSFSRGRPTATWTLENCPQSPGGARSAAGTQTKEGEEGRAGDSQGEGAMAGPLQHRRFLGASAGRAHGGEAQNNQMRRAVGPVARRAWGLCSRWQEGGRSWPSAMKMKHRSLFKRKKTWESAIQVLKV